MSAEWRIIMKKHESFELISYSRFLLKMKETVEVIIGNCYNVSINHVIKNNSVELDGIVILQDTEKITPNIYLNSFYERYLNGESIAMLAHEIVTIYKNSKDIENRESIRFCYEFAEMRDSIIYRIINYDKNVKLLKDVPHILFLDLAITFHCLIRSNEEGIGTIRITNDHVKSWDIDMNQLIEIARINTPKLFPAVIKSMSEVVFDVVNKKLEAKTDITNHIEQMKIEQKKKEQDEIFSYVIEDSKRHRTDEMYVITNTKGINGASCLLYPNVIKNFADQLDTDFYILPSSIHELILVKATKSLTKQTLMDMVIDVNKTQVPEEEILSNNVYYYSRERDALTL